MDVYRAMRGAGAREDVAEDIVADLYVRLMESNATRLRNASFENETQFRWWLIIIARNLLRTLQRRDKHATHVSQEVLEAASHSPVNQSNSTEMLSEIGNRQEGAQALACLTPKERYYIQLFYYEELKYREIANLSAVTMGAVSFLINRAKSKMKAHLQQNGSHIRSSNEEVER